MKIVFALILGIAVMTLVGCGNPSHQFEETQGELVADYAPDSDENLNEDSGSGSMAPPSVDDRAQLYIPSRLVADVPVSIRYGGTSYQISSKSSAAALKFVNEQVKRAQSDQSVLLRIQYEGALVAEQCSGFCPPNTKVLSIVLSSIRLSEANSKN